MPAPISVVSVHPGCVGRGWFLDVTIEDITQFGVGNGFAFDHPVGLLERGAFGDALPAGVRLRQAHHVGIELDAVGAQAACCRGENRYILTEYPLDRSHPDWTTFGEP